MFNFLKHLQKQSVWSEYNGHRPLAPANQYCAYCGAPMFIKECTNKPCVNLRPSYFTEEDWEAEMQLAVELAK